MSCIRERSPPASLMSAPVARHALTMYSKGVFAFFSMFEAAAKSGCVRIAFVTAFRSPFVLVQVLTTSVTSFSAGSSFTR